MNGGIAGYINNECQYTTFLNFYMAIMYFNQSQNKIISNISNHKLLTVPLDVLFSQMHYLLIYSIITVLSNKSILLKNTSEICYLRKIVF